MSVLKSNETEVNLILLDEDPIFSLGLKEICRSQKISDINIIATGKIKDIYSFLEQYQVDLWVITLDFDRFNLQVKEFISQVPQLCKKYPELNLLLMLNPKGLLYDFSNLSIIKGCCYKYTDIDELIKIFRLCASGESYFHQQDNFSSQPRKFNHWFYQQSKLGLKEINKQIIELNQYTKNKQLSVLDLIYWQGRKRELKLTKWLINKALPKNILNMNTPHIPSTDSVSLLKENTPEKKKKNQIVLTDKSFTNYDFTIAKINNSVKNCTNNIYETDILKQQKKKELFLNILEQWNETIYDLKQYNLTSLELKNKVQDKSFMIKIIQDSIINFTEGVTYIYSENKNSIIKSEELDLVNQNISDFISDNVLKIPFLDNLINYQVLQKELVIDNQIYEYENDTAQEIEAIIIDNLVISCANYVMEFILNKFYDNLIIKDNLFETELKSSRKVAMFRNNLVWKYRREIYWQNPKNIFEDKYEMLRFTYQGIETCTISHSRHLELNQIKGIPWLVTILIELRDSLSRGIRALGDSLGQVIIYLLTEVIGKGIGLIGKGILQGIGSKIKN